MVAFRKFLSYLCDDGGSRQGNGGIILVYFLGGGLNSILAFSHPKVNIPAADGNLPEFVIGVFQVHRLGEIKLPVTDGLLHFIMYSPRRYSEFIIMQIYKLLKTI